MDDNRASNAAAADPCPEERWARPPDAVETTALGRSRRRHPPMSSRGPKHRTDPLIEKVSFHHGREGKGAGRRTLSEPDFDPVTGGLTRAIRAKFMLIGAPR